MDPFDAYDDDALWAVLRKVELGRGRIVALCHNSSAAYHIR